MAKPHTTPNYTPEEKIARISTHFAEIMRTLGLDLTDPSLKDTPNRVAKMYVKEIYRGLSLPLPKLTTFPNTKMDQMVLIRNITTFSHCEHHFVPIVGRTHVAYIPNTRILGLSKFNRLVQHLASKPQVQERLTTEIAETLQKELKTENVAVLMEATHYCCASRGVQDVNSDTVTSYLGGAFKDGNLRAEFLTLYKK